MGAVISSHSGIRTECPISHCFVMDVPGYPEPLIITDAAINIAPDLDAKVDIVQNAIDLAHAIGVHEVRVAILSALETVTAKVPSTIEAAALCKMAERGQFGARLSTGPWRSTTQSVLKRRSSRSSRPLSPGVRMCSWFLTSRPATCSPKAYHFWLRPMLPEIVLGARVPIILTSRPELADEPPRILRRRRDDRGGEAQSGFRFVGLRTANRLMLQMGLVSGLDVRGSTFSPEAYAARRAGPRVVGPTSPNGSSTAELVSAPQQSGNSRLPRKTLRRLRQGARTQDCRPRAETQRRNRRHGIMVV